MVLLLCYLFGVLLYILLHDLFGFLVGWVLRFCNLDWFGVFVGCAFNWLLWIYRLLVCACLLGMSRGYFCFVLDCILLL